MMYIARETLGFRWTEITSVFNATHAGILTPDKLQGRSHFPFNAIRTLPYPSRVARGRSFGIWLSPVKFSAHALTLARRARIANSLQISITQIFTNKTNSFAIFVANLCYFHSWPICYSCPTDKDRMVSCYTLFK